MTTLGLEDSLVLALARGVADPGEGEQETLDWAADIFARASWTGIAEPGDALAGHLVSSLGAGMALASLVEAWPVTRLIHSLGAARAESVQPRELEAALERWRPRLVSGAAITSLRQAARLSVRMLRPGDGDWPTGLGDLGIHGPIALWARGPEVALKGLARSVALVGARAATGYGEHMALEFSAGLCDRGYTVVSGAAYGIDGMAHRAALASGGLTVAFLAGGVDRFYPSGHDALLTRISQVGTVLSELPLGSPPTKWRFLQRNRLIAAVTSGTVVIEAGHRSGSLNTAGHAAALGRPLGAVPGPVTSPASAGCHRLLREFDAVCVTSADDVVELLGSMATTSGEATPATEPLELRVPEAIRVLDALSKRSKRDASDVARRAGLSVPVTEAMLGLLQLDGAAQEADAGWTKK
jgi:DNA processing protein